MTFLDTDVVDYSDQNTNYAWQDGVDLDNFSIEEELKLFEDMKLDGWFVVLRLYVPPKNKNGLILPTGFQEEFQYKAQMGLVVKIGKGAYEDERYKHTGPWCKLGQWHQFEKHRGRKSFYKQRLIYQVPDDAIGFGGDPRNVKI